MKMRITLVRVDDRVNAIAITKLIRQATGQNLFVSKSLAENLLLGQEASIELIESVDVFAFSNEIEKYGIKATLTTASNG